MSLTVPRLVAMVSTLVALFVIPGPARAGFVAEVHQQKIPGTSIAYYERGEGRPLIMLTGTGSTMSEWDPGLVRKLSRSRRLILLDYPGLGRSGPAHGRYTFRRVAFQVNQFIRARGLRRPDLLGWSMGGFVAQQLAIHHPGSIRRLILAGTNPGGDRAILGPPWVQKIDSHPDSDRQALKLLYPRTRAGQKEGRRFLHRLAEAAVARSEIPDDFHVPAMTLNRQVAAEDPWLRSNRNFRRLSRLRVRTLVTAGRADPVTPPENARTIARRIPRAKLRVLPGAHAFLFQSRGRFTALLNGFLAPALSQVACRRGP